MGWIIGSPVSHTQVSQDTDVAIRNICIINYPALRLGTFAVSSPFCVVLYRLKKEKKKERKKERAKDGFYTAHGEAHERKTAAQA